MTHNFDLFGTDHPPVPRYDYSHGPWSFAMEDGAMRHIMLHGVESIRAIAFLVRDRDWGTLLPTITNEKTDRDVGTLTHSYDATYTTGDATLKVQIKIAVSTGRLTMSAVGTSHGAFETNRAGFTVLHPILDVAGQPVQVKHSDGTIADSRFPDLIAPWQPFKDIAALTHRVEQTQLTCRFQGDTFEMEDQRQWGDASYKTYNRPLAKPWPYVVEDGAAIDQSITLSWHPASPSLTSKPIAKLEKLSFLEMALGLTPEQATRLAENPKDIQSINPQRLLCHLNTTLGGTQEQFAAFAAAQRACPNQSYDLELICTFKADPLTELSTLAAEMHSSEFVPDSILVCPAADRQSTPPGSEWPPCPPLTDIHAAAAVAFPNAVMGGGMVSFFPELNRKRPPVDMLSFVSHGLCPIVHAADDISVMETLEAVGHITRSARAIIGEKEYRIGPATLAMRQNPYGTRTLPNATQMRLCMTDDDPRHRAKFGAAYTLGLATALASSGASIWCPADVYGVRGVISDGDEWPIQSALKALARMAGKPVHSAEVEKHAAKLCIEGATLSVNLTPEQAGPLGPYDWVLEP